MQHQLEDHANDPDLVACDDGEHFVSLRKDWDWYGWVLRKHPDGGIYSVRKATDEEIKRGMVKRASAQLPEIQPSRPHGRLA